MYDVYEALVLRSVKYKEADLILTVLTAERGLLTVTARGVRRKGSAMAAAVQLFSYVKMTLYGRHGHLYIKETEILELFAGLRNDIEDMALAGWFVELAGTLSAEEIPAAELHPLTLGALYALANGLREPALIKAAYEFRAMAESGYAPSLDGCAACGAEHPAEPLFDARNGSVYCRTCSSGEDTQPLAAAALAAMRHAVTKDIRRFCAFALDDAEPFAHAAEAYLRTHLDAQFPALAFYHSVKM